MLSSDSSLKIKADAEAHLTSINTYYDSPAVLLFERFAKQQIHLGYWDDKYPNVSLEQAAMRLTQVVINYINLPKDRLFLDIGCGCGHPSIEIAKQKNCLVEGITINPQQKLKAEDLARTHHLSERVKFKIADASKLPYQDGLFDSALMLESIHHIGHIDALREASRVLKKGGEIIIADGTAMKENAPFKDKHRLGELFVSKSLTTPSQLKQIMIDTGFAVSETLDITRAVLPTWDKLLEETQRNEQQIIENEGLEFYQTLMAFWTEIKYLWRSNAKYLLYKGIKK